MVFGYSSIPERQWAELCRTASRCIEEVRRSGHAEEKFREAFERLDDESMVGRSFFYEQLIRFAREALPRADREVVVGNPQNPDGSPVIAHLTHCGTHLAVAQRELFDPPEPLLFSPEWILDGAERERALARILEKADGETRQKALRLLGRS